MVGREHLAGHRQSLGDVDGGELSQRGRCRHVGDQSPFGLQDGEVGVRRGEPEVGSHRNLQSAAVAMAMHHSDDGDRYPPPLPCGVLKTVGALHKVRDEVPVDALLFALEAGEIKSGAEGFARAADDDGAQGAVLGRLPGRSGEPGEQRQGESVVLVGPIELYMRDGTERCLLHPVGHRIVSRGACLRVRGNRQRCGS